MVLRMLEQTRRVDSISGHPPVEVTTTPSPIADALNVTFGPVEQLSPMGVGNTNIPPIQTPADEWANLLLDRALPLLNQPAMPAEDLVWWQAHEARGALEFGQDAITLNGMPLEISPLQRIELFMADRAKPEHLVNLGSVVPNRGVLVLAISNPDADTTRRWILSNGSPALALRALIAQAAMRGVILHIAYAPSAGAGIELVILEAQTVDLSSPTVVASSTPGPSPTATRTPTPTITLTPTRPPDAYLGRVVAEKIDPVIDAVERLSPTTTLAFVERHPWAGLLASSEAGPQVAGRPVATDQAQEVNFYVLVDPGHQGTVERFLTAVYTPEGTTRLPDELIYFQGHRMSEILYWMTVRAAERGGYLIVAYDDFGARQAITVAGFLLPDS